jgi:hypothetical protein
MSDHRYYQLPSIPLSLRQIGVFVGWELFYITFFPFIGVNVDLDLCRRVVFVWVIAMSSGQALKDHFKVRMPFLFSIEAPFEGNLHQLAGSLVTTAHTSLQKSLAARGD